MIQHGQKERSKPVVFDHDPLVLSGYEPMQLAGKMTAQHIPLLMHFITFVDILILGLVLGVPIPVATFFGRKSVAHLMLGFVFVLFGIYFYDAMRHFQALDKICSRRNWGHCPIAEHTQYKIMNEQTQLGRDLFVCLTSILVTAILVQVAYYKNKVQELKDQ